MSAGTSDRLCTFVAGAAPDAVPAATLHAAKRVLLDAAGVMMGASGLAPEARPFLAVARAGGEGPSSILGTGAHVAPAMAALANGAMAHALDYEDAFDGTTGHPNASLVPVLLALAQSQGPVSGPRFLTALAVGCEVSCRVGLALRRQMEVGGWYPPPIQAGLGAVMGAANLLGLDARQTRDALSLMLCQVTMPGEIKHSRDTVIRAVREGFPAQAAVLSALLAREGVAGFEAPLEGKSGFYALYADGKFDPAVLTSGPGETWCIEQMTFKPWPSCRGTHPFIELALDLRARHGIAPASIAEIVVEVDDVQQMLVDPLARKQAPATVIDAKFSVPFCTAIALVRGAVTLDTFVAASLTDPAVLAVAGKVRPTVASASTRQRGSGGALTIRMTDGASYSGEVHNALGCPDRPLDDAALIAKFSDCAGRAQMPLAESEAGRMAGAIMQLETCADVGALFA